MGNALLKAITKTTILALTSFLISAAMSLIVCLVGSSDYEDKSLDIVLSLLVIMDIYSNFICVVLTYSMFDKQYRCLCGCIDVKCRNCLFRIALSKWFKRDKVQIESIELECHSPTISCESPRN